MRRVGCRPRANHGCAQAIVRAPGAIEDLLDRSTEADAQAREWKFAVITALASASDGSAGDRPTSELLGDALYQRLMHEIRMGPHGVPARTDVATEMR